MNAFFALLVTAALVGHGEARGHALCVQPVDSNAAWFGQGGLDFDMASPPLKCGRRATATSVTTTITTVTTTVATTVSTTTAATTTTTVTTTVTTTTTACPKCDMYAGFIGGNCAAMIDAGSTAVCESMAIKYGDKSSSTSNPLSACMAPAFSLMCPGSWAGNTLPILKSAKAVKCMTCSAPTIGTDQNPAAGEYFVNIKWGRNVHNDGQKVQFQETVLEGYNVVIVDKNMRILQKVASVPKDGKSSTCCDMAYSKTVQGTWPEGGAKFMVVPYSTGVGAQHYANMPSTFMLPMGQTGDFTDVKTGRTTVLKGSIGFDVPDLNSIKQHQMGVVMQEAIAKTLDGIEPENVAIIKITVSTRLRRLGAELRKLFAGKVMVEYAIMIPKTYSGPTINKATIEMRSTQLATEIKTTAKSLGIETEVVSIVPSAVLVTLIEATTTTTTTTTTSTTTTMTTTTTTKPELAGVAASGSVTSTAVASVFIAIFAAIERKLLA